MTCYNLRNKCALVSCNLVSKVYNFQVNYMSKSCKFFTLLLPPPPTSNSKSHQPPSRADTSIFQALLHVLTDEFPAKITCSQGTGHVLGKLTVAASNGWCQTTIKGWVAKHEQVWG